MTNRGGEIPKEKATSDESLPELADRIEKKTRRRISNLRQELELLSKNLQSKPKQGAGD